jgi:3-hydroxyacyl-CoA dehydrogenase
VLAEGVASAEEIDSGMKLGAIHPIGTAHAYPIGSTSAVW